VVLGQEFLQQTTERVRVIQDRMRATQSRQKSYADKRRRPLEFVAGDHVFLRVTPIAGIGRALKSRKLTPPVHWSVSDYEEDRNRRVRDYLASSLGESAQRLSCFTIEEVRGRS